MLLAMCFKEKKEDINKLQNSKVSYWSYFILHINISP